MLGRYLILCIAVIGTFGFPRPLRVNRQSPPYRENEVIPTQNYVKYDTFGGKSEVAQYEPFISKIRTYAEKADFIRYLQHILNDDEAPVSSKENPLQSYENLKKSKFFSPRINENNDYASPPGKRQIRFHQCYFNPVSCFRKRSIAK